jgi:hypothetical protein
MGRQLKRCLDVKNNNKSEQKELHDSGVIT